MTVVQAECYPVPVLGRPRALRTPRVAEGRVGNGLSVLIVRKPSVPRAEFRLLIPTGGGQNPAAARVLTRTLTSGTSSRSSAEIAEELQRLGADFSAGASPDHISISGSVLAPNLGPYLSLVAELVGDSQFPRSEVVLERARAAQEVQIARSQPQFVAQEALMRRLFGRHPYGTVSPDPAAIERTAPATVRRLAAETIGPRRAVLVLVGDLQPGHALEVVESALGGWRRRRKASAVAEPAPVKTGPTLVVDRAGSVQTNIRMAGPALPPGHPDFYALEIANTIFGGYFISRFVENLRERKGYTYSPHSRLSHRLHASFIEVAADVGAEVTVPALVETRYELGRMAALEVDPGELVSAQRYRAGLLSVRIQSQAGLASTLAALVVHELDVSYLRSYPRRISAVTGAEVLEAARRFLAPSRLVTVLVGDADRVAKEVEPLEPVKIQRPAGAT